MSGNNNKSKKSNKVVLNEAVTFGFETKKNIKNEIKKAENKISFGDFSPENNFSGWSQKKSRNPKPHSNNPSPKEDTFITAGPSLKNQIRTQVKEGSLIRHYGEGETVVTSQGIKGNNTHITNDKKWGSMHITMKGSHGERSVGIGSDIVLKGFQKDVGNTDNIDGIVRVHEAAKREKMDNQRNKGIVHQSPIEFSNRTSRDIQREVDNKKKEGKSLLFGVIESPLKKGSGLK